MSNGSFSRRRFLGGAVTLVCGAPVFGAVACGTKLSPKPQLIDGWSIPLGTMLPAARYAQVAALLDALVPGDDAGAGATEAHAAWYLDQLLGAFRTDPPRLYAGGPYSGRHGGVDGFSHFQPLTRVETIRWRTHLEGSQGIAEREFNGPVKGLLQLYEENLDLLEQAAQKQNQLAFTALDLEPRRTILATADQTFVQVAYGHAVEGTYGDPVYGGNFELSGWQVISYEGDRQPIGYTARQMSNPEEG